MLRRWLQTGGRRAVGSDGPFGEYDRIVEGRWRRETPFGPTSLARVPSHIDRPDYGAEDEVESAGGMTDELLRRMRRTGRLAREVLNFAGSLVKPGVTTADIDSKVMDYIFAQHAYPSPLDYQGFPRSMTASVNNILAHGIPDERPLLPGDIVCLDVTVFREGVHGDTSDTFCVGSTVDEKGRDLVQSTRAALAVGIDAVRQGLFHGQPLFSDIGRAISKFAASKGYAVNDQFSGHAIDTVFHRPPWIFHHENALDDRIPNRIAFTIEPILVQTPPGTAISKINPRMAKGHHWKDGWTMASLSGARAAQAEHTVWVGDGRLEVLTG